MSTATPTPNRPRSRLTLLLVAVAFLTPFIAAVILRFGGWQPVETRNYGSLLQPPLSMAKAIGERDDGQRWVWENTEYQWTLLARAPASCEGPCGERLAVLRNVRTALARHAPRLHLFRVDGAAPEGFAALKLSGELPAPLRTPVEQEVEVWLVDPHGYLVLHYPAGFDPNGLRRDLSRLIK